jgi:hypothetical protein
MVQISLLSGPEATRILPPVAASLASKGEVESTMIREIRTEQGVTTSLPVAIALAICMTGMPCRGAVGSANATSTAATPQTEGTANDSDSGAAEPTFLRDRGPGVPTSQFGTYVRRHELLVYGFYEFTYNSDEEYKPEELGFGLDEDFRAKRTDHEALIFLSYGFAEDFEVELESALYTTATQHKDSNDPSAMPAKLEESGLGDTEGQLRWRLAKEKENAPEVFTYFEAVLPLQRDRVLIGTQDWELALGGGLIKGTRCGTFTARAAESYTPADGTIEFGEYAVEYLKRISPHWRGFLSVEGEQDEVALIAEAQLHLRPDLFIKANNGFGLTSKAPDYAPEIGLIASFR